ncbi:hypothetical protein D6855_02605 [Butyrivibrio sp. CB08]|uniref:DUF6449 domain-containing protein n=1 Tax=Butyrivibrio sp. CB08 TaxID=2364879 RepID=UPI000EAAAD93|nr:DUF6449 domain-containing protein [Butyrivibrio sp. CB08]RKM62328.1 hypothetical protein D6855_02605 [Butyrivibrio sp. CB08]
MTSANLSLGEKIKNRRTYINRTLWTSFVVLPFYAAYFILGVIMLVSRSINYANVYHQTQQVLYREKLAATASVVGFRSMVWILVIGTAVMFALQGFSYVFNTSQIDFYLSQPTTRAQRIKRNYFNAFGTFLSIYIGTELIALIVAAAMGAVNGNVLMSALIETVREFILFFAFYNMTVLAVMLSGSLPIAIILTAAFTFVSVIIAGEIALFKGIFFSTYDSEEPFKVIFSPIYDRVSSMMDIYTLRNVGENYILNPGYVRQCIETIMDREIDTVVVGVIAFIAVLIFSRLRRTEWAGKSIPLRPFRWFIKVLGSAIIGIGSGLFVFELYSSVWNSRLYVMMCVVMILATIFAGCVIEVIMEGNIRRMFKGVAQTVMAIAIVVLVFVIYKGDLLGFDSYVPAASKVESCAIISSDRTFHFFHGYYGNSDFSSKDYMEIKDVDTFIEIARVGMDAQKITRINEQAGRYSSTGYQVSVLYRLKNGRDVYRYITIPYDAVDEQLNKIVSSDEYKTGCFEVFHDDYVREADKTAVNRSLGYNTSLDSQETQNFDYTEFSDAYRKDILAYYSFDSMKNKMPVGQIEYEVNDENYIYGTFEVYDTYTNTIDLLKKYGIYLDSTITVSDVRKITVTNYYPGYDLEKIDYQDIEEYPDSKEMSYTDEKQIEEILGSIISTDYYNPWYNYNNNNEQYSAQIYTTEDRSKYAGSYYTFIKGQVPDFVVADTN